MARIQRKLGVRLPKRGGGEQTAVALLADHPLLETEPSPSAKTGSA